MTVLYIILLAIVQGITEFLPVSSFGHLCFVQNLLGMEHGPGVLLETMLHLGTLAAIFMTFQKDIRHLAFEALDMFMDLIGNANLYIHNRRTGEQLHYTRISEVCSFASCSYDSDCISGLHCKTAGFGVRHVCIDSGGRDSGDRYSFAGY